MMEIFIALLCDKHVDEEIRVFLSRESAINCAKQFADDNNRHGVTEEEIDGWEYFASYSAGESYVRVTKGVLE